MVLCKNVFLFCLPCFHGRLAIGIPGRSSFGGFLGFGRRFEVVGRVLRLVWRRRGREAHELRVVVFVVGGDSVLCYFGFPALTFFMGLFNIVQWTRDEVVVRGAWFALGTAFFSILILKFAIFPLCNQ